MNDYQNDNLRRKTEKVLLPAAGEFRALLAEFAKNAGQDVDFEFNFRAISRGGAGTVKAVFICPDEFDSLGDGCDTMIASVLAFGGTCVDTVHNTVCELPDRFPPDPAVPDPTP
jgi:hypothetical protein